MFITPVNVHGLKSMLDGYGFAIQAHQIEDSIFDDNFSFHDWVAMHHGYYESTKGWANIIEENTNSDEEGLELFFNYYESYKARKRKILLEKSVPKENFRQPWKMQVMVSKESDFVDHLCLIWPHNIQIVSYREGDAVFLRYLDKLGNLLEREEYCSNIALAQEKLESQCKKRISATPSAILGHI